MQRTETRLSLPNFLFGFCSLATVVLSICVLLGCGNPSESTFQLYSVNASTVTHILGKSCTSCNFTAIPDRYMFGLSGTCRSTSKTVVCQRAFPNTFNITAVTFADISSLSSSSISSTNVGQYGQNTSTGPINHTLVRHLSQAVCAVLIISIVLNILFIPLRLVIDRSKPMSKTYRTFFLFLLLDLCAQCAAVGMVYLIVKNEITRPLAVKVGTGNTGRPVQFEVGYWLLIGAAASRPLGAVLSGLLFVEGEPNHRQQGRSGRSNKPNTLRDADNVDPIFYANLTYKLARTISVLRAAVETYPFRQIFDKGCEKLLTEVRNDEKLASLISNHFNRNSANLFLGVPPTVTGSPPGQLLWEGCPNNGYRVAPESRSRGVYLIVLSECCHRGGMPTNTPVYEYVGSGRSLRGGVMLRVAEHTDPTFRKHEEPHSNLYKVWNRLSSPCVSIYLLAEWDSPPPNVNTSSAEAFNDILLAEAIWQVALQSSVPDRPSDFTQYLQGLVPGKIDLSPNFWIGCNIKSALEE
ncbi:hypothetical protein BGZ60DRAFT_205553 [Tricladium varicosporioides]|nr:hypothetical protein BGZ60DRAFT_205553 [Hymenoscyphus varicosporioides]